MAKKFIALIRVVSPGESRLHLVDREKFVVGRAPDSDVVVISSSVSRKHLAVEIRNQSIVIEDLGSSNGSFLNDLKMDGGKKYPVPEKTAIRLGTSNETISIELMERPVEFDNYHSYLPKFNQDLLGMMDQMLKEAQVKSDKLLQEAQRQADHYVSQAQAQGQALIQKVKIQEETSLDVATKKATQLIQEAEKEAKGILENSRSMAQNEAETIRNSVREEAEAVAAKRLEQVRDEVQRIYQKEVGQVHEKAFREVQAEAELSRNRLREQLHELKVQGQIEAEKLIQDAHKEASRVKETGVQEFEKLRLEGQKRAQKLLDDAEAEASKILQNSREAAEKMRQMARVDFDETMARIKNQTSEMIQNGEKESQEILDSARKRAQQIVENQERESALILSDLGARIQAEAQKEAQRLIKQTEDQIEESKAQARREVLAAQAQKAQLEEQISFFNKEHSAQVQRKATLQAEIQSVETSLAQLKEENSKQSALAAKLETFEQQVKTLELQRIQMQEKNAKAMEEFELLKKNTFEELERNRRSEEKKIMNLASIKAKEFTQRLEKVLIGDISRTLGHTMSPTDLSEISRKLTEEMIAMFASETFKHEEAQAMKAQSAAPGLFQSKVFRWGVALAAVAGAFYLVQNSRMALQRQAEFTANLIEKQREDVRFKPTLTADYRGTYTDNVLYMERYLELKNDPKIQDQWALNLNDFFLSELRLSEEKMVRFIGLESALLKRLTTLRESVDARYLEEGINQMRAAEKEEVAKIQQLLENPSYYARLRTREKIFLNQARQGLPLRNPAQQDVSTDSNN